MISIIQLSIIAAYLLNLIPEQNESFLFWSLALISALGLFISLKATAMVNSIASQMDGIERLRFEGERQGVVRAVSKQIFVCILSIITLVFWY